MSRVAEVDDMDMQKIADRINEYDDWIAAMYTRDEVTKIITEPVEHLTVHNLVTDDEFDLKIHRCDWAVTCETAELDTVCELRDLLREVTDGFE